LGLGGNGGLNTLATPLASSAIRPFVTAGGRTQVSIERLNLTPNQPVYVAVRAKNGQGATSPIGVSMAVRYDPTPPVVPIGAVLAPWSLTKAHIAFPVPAAATYTACPIAQPAFPGSPLGGFVFPIQVIPWGGGGTPPPTGATPSIVFRLPAITDAESGIASYWYKITQQPESTFSEAGWSTLFASNGFFTLLGGPLNYSGTFYLSLVTRNAAGLYSTPMVSGPFTVPDPSGPSAPEYCAGANTGAATSSFFVNLTKEAADDETQITGYQYRVRSAAGTVVRNWPASGVDWAAGSGARNTAALTLVGGERYYIDVRALNGQSMESNWVTAGPVAYDPSAPPTPAASLTIPPAGTAGQPQLTVSIPVDPETGISSLQWAVGTSATTADFAAWQAMPTSGGGMTIIVPGTVPPVGTTLWARVRTVNGAGMPSAVFTTSFTVPPPPTLQTGGVGRERRLP
jgi:hypothetical protein